MKQPGRALLRLGDRLANVETRLGASAASCAAPSQGQRYTELDATCARHSEGTADLCRHMATGCNTPRQIGLRELTADAQPLDWRWTKPTSAAGLYGLASPTVKTEVFSHSTQLRNYAKRLPQKKEERRAQLRNSIRRPPVSNARQQTSSPQVNDVEAVKSAGKEDSLTQSGEGSAIEAQESRASDAEVS